MKRIVSMILALGMLLGLFAGCGNDSTKSTTPPESSADAPPQEARSEAPTDVETKSVVDSDLASIEDGTIDNTEANANFDYSAHQELLKSLHTTLPIVDEPVTLTYWLDFETATLTYLENGDLNNHPMWSTIGERTGVDIDITMVDKNNANEKFQIMIASGDYPDLFKADQVTNTIGMEYAYSENILMALDDYLVDYAPNYWTLIHSDQNILDRVTSASGHFLEMWTLKDQVATPDDQGAFIRMDWLEDLNLEVPQTYDDLFEVLSAFKTEKGATEPLMLFNTIAPSNGNLIGGFGSMAVLSTAELGDATTGCYQIDGEVRYGAIEDGTRKFLSYLHKLYDAGLIDFETMMNRERNPFADETLGRATRGEVGFMYNDTPFGGVYGSMTDDPNCNWWPINDVAETPDGQNHFMSEVSLVKQEGLVVSTACEEPEAAVGFLDYWYSYEGYLLANYGFEGEHWNYDENGIPQFIPEVVNQYENVNLAMCSFTSQDVGGVYADLRLAEAGDNPWTDREYACFEAWSTRKDSAYRIGKLTQLTQEEATAASNLYSDILTYVATSALQFVNGDLDVDDDAVWNAYVENIKAMNVDELIAIVQGAYDRAYS